MNMQYLFALQWQFNQRDVCIFMPSNTGQQVLVRILEYYNTLEVYFCFPGNLRAIRCYMTSQKCSQPGSKIITRKYE